MREMSVSEQRYKAVLAVISDGRQVSEVAAAWGVSRQTLHTWLARYEDGGLEGLADRSHRPVSCPHRMEPAVEVAVLEIGRQHPGWGPRRIVHELGRAGTSVSESGVYRALRRARVIDPDPRRRQQRTWRRWERARPNELWQLDVVGGILLADGTTLKCLTGIDDHSRYCVCAALLPRERIRLGCDAFEQALAQHGVPEQVLTDNGKVFTGRFNQPPTEVLFDKICRTNGIEHLLTKPRSPTTTGKIERFHRSLRAEFLTGAVFPSQAVAQQRLDEWVAGYNTDRPHQAIDMATPAERFSTAIRRPVTTEPDRSGPQWVARKVSAVGVVCVSWQQVSVGKHRAGERCDVHVGPDILQFWIGNQLLRTVKRDSTGPVRNKRPQGGALTRTPPAQ